jgi:putative transposase
MRYEDSVIARLFKPVCRRAFAAAVKRHDGDAYDKSFRSWDHFVALIFAQLSRIDCLRSLEAVWNAHSHHHYPLGTRTLRRSTLSEANSRRPVAIFAETFATLSKLAGRTLRRDGAEMLRIIDSTSIPAGQLVTWATWNGRIRGLKLHVLYNPLEDRPQRIAITPSTVNDVLMGEQVAIEAGAIYAFDKGYCSYTWWSKINQAGSVFVTRPKTNVSFKVIRWRKLEETRGDGFTVLGDAEVKLASQGRTKLAFVLRRIRIRRDDGGVLTVITNDLQRSAVEIAAFYKARWQIELLFRWLKQHLKLKKFLARSENGVRLQVIAAMIAYLLLRIAARESRSAVPAIRFAELIAGCLFARKPIAKIDKPPDVHPSKAKPFNHPDQFELSYA